VQDDEAACSTLNGLLDSGDSIYGEWQRAGCGGGDHGEVRITFVLQGDPSDFGGQQRADFRNGIKYSFAGIENVHLSMTAGSTIVVIVIYATESVSVSSIAADLENANVDDPAVMEGIILHSTGLTVTVVPGSYGVVVVEGPGGDENGDDGLSTGAIVGIAVGGAVGAALLVGAAFFMCKGSKAKGQKRPPAPSSV